MQKCIAELGLVFFFGGLFWFSVSVHRVSLKRHVLLPGLVCKDFKLKWFVIFFKDLQTVLILNVFYTSGEGAPHLTERIIGENAIERICIVSSRNPNMCMLTRCILQMTAIFGVI